MNIKSNKIIIIKKTKKTGHEQKINELKNNKENS